MDSSRSVRSPLDQWARDHKRRRLQDIRKERQSPPWFHRVLPPKWPRSTDELRFYVAVDLGRDEGSKP